MPSYRGPPPSGQLWHPAVVVHVQATSNCIPAFPRCAGLRLSVSHPRGRVRRSRPPRRWSGEAPPQEQVRAQLKQLGSGTYVHVDLTVSKAHAWRSEAWPNSRGHVGNSDDPGIPVGGVFGCVQSRLVVRNDDPARDEHFHDRVPEARNHQVRKSGGCLRLSDHLDRTGLAGQLVVHGADHLPQSSSSSRPVFRYRPRCQLLRRPHLDAASRRRIGDLVECRVPSASRHAGGLRPQHDHRWRISSRNCRESWPWTWTMFSPWC